MRKRDFFWGGREFSVASMFRRIYNKKEYRDYNATGRRYTRSATWELSNMQGLRTLQ